MVTAQTSLPIPLVRASDAGDTRKKPSPQRTKVRTRRARTDSDDVSDKSTSVRQTLDGALCQSLSGSLPQFGHFPAFPTMRLKRSPGMAELVPKVAPIEPEHPSSPAFASPPSSTTPPRTELQRQDPGPDATQQDINSQRDDASLSSFHSDDQPTPVTQIFASGSRQRSPQTPVPRHPQRSPGLSTELTGTSNLEEFHTPQCFEDWVNEVLATETRGVGRPTRALTSPTVRRSSLDDEFSKTDTVRPELYQADGSFSRRESKVRRASGLSEVQTHSNRYSIDASNGNARTSTEVTSEADSSGLRADPFGPSTSEPGAGSSAMTDLSVGPKDDGVLGYNDPESAVTPRPYLPTRLSYVSRPGVTDLDNDWNQSPALRLERPDRRRSVSSESAIPLRMEPDDCSSIACELPPESQVEGGNNTSSNSSAPARKTISGPLFLPRPTKAPFSPAIEPLGTPADTPDIGNTSSIDHAYCGLTGEQGLAPRLPRRPTDSDKITLSPDHPANKIFASAQPEGPPPSGDAPALDGNGSAWTVGSPLSIPPKDPDMPAGPSAGEVPPGGSYEMEELEASDKVPDTIARRKAHSSFNLRGRRHFSLEPHRPFNPSRSHQRAPIARDWSTAKKRFTATVACISTALMGLIIGIYAGEVPAIQYMVVDQRHQVVLGNVVFFLGLALPTAFLYPLPLLHGRKPYTLTALTILLPLQFPPAMIVSQQRSPDLPWYRAGLLLSRGFSGLAMGLANFNFLGTLLDLFGASLMSTIPHQEAVIEHDPRRHGGGMGLWLGIWTWCFLGSIGLGFFLGAIIISGLNVAWGFWIMIVLTAAVLVLNVVTPEVRRSAFRTSVAEVHKGDEVSHRIARGEMMMHLYATGPLRWWEEVVAGIRLEGRMLKQPGFLIMAVYIGWMYAQVVLVILLLGALTSRYYRFYPQTVALCVASVPIGALFAVPFQKASLLSRARHRPPRTDSMTFEKRVTWTSHLVRRVIFMVSLPLAGVAYALVSGGPPMPAAVPSVLAGLVGFLSALALSECVGLIMETFDVSDLQPGMTGRRRSTSKVPEAELRRQAHYSSFPRVTAGLAAAQALGFALAAAATACAGNVTRAIGAQAATGVVAGILLVMTLALVAALTRVRRVQIVPRDRLDSVALRGPGADLPVVIGHPSGFDRKVSWLELGRWTRWEEIRRRNHLASGLNADRIWQPRPANP